MDAQTSTSWIDRMGSGMRTTLIIVTAILALFSVGLVAGFSFAIVEDGEVPTKPSVYIIFAAMVAFAGGVFWLLAALIRSLRPATMSRFDRRYMRMWFAIIGLSVPVGIGLAMLGLNDQQGGILLVVSNDPIAPLTAIFTSIVLCAVMVLAAISYHRTVDDHEQHAYLWGSTISYYFLVLGFPLYWLLARGGLVPQITIGIALLIILLSCVVQALVWASFKFR